ncbi:MAG: hypothetical protein V4478_01605 [Patescibacteria group bacterium]
MNTTPQYTAPLQPSAQPAPARSSKGWILAAIIAAVIAVAAAVAWYFLIHKKGASVSDSNLQKLEASSDTIQINIDNRSAKLKQISNSSTATSVPIEDRRAMLNSLK